MKNLILMSMILFSSLAFPQDNDQKETNKAFNQALASYENLYQSFIENDLKKIKENAKLLSQEIEKIQDEQISKLLTYTKIKLQEIGSSDQIEKRKDAMNTVSQGLLVVLEKQAPNKNYARYYCPMVKKYWIQNISKSNQVMNPYEFDSMPHCGSMKSN